MKLPFFERLCLIGIGLIGASVAKSARKRGLVREIVVCSRTQDTLQRAEALSLGDVYVQDPEEAVLGADLVLLCTPVGAFEALAQRIAPALQKGALISDVGSVKKAVIRAIQPHLPEAVVFIPGHPVAGTEHSGPEAGLEDLFENRWCILTPLPETPLLPLKKLRNFWEGCGSRIAEMTPEHHDLALAMTSHLPHLIAYNLVGMASDLEDITQKDIIQFSAGGFRDATRLAASDPIMWRDIFLNNREAVLDVLSRFSEDLVFLRRAIRQGDGTALSDFFSRARGLRRRIVAAGQEVDAPDFGRHLSCVKTQILSGGEGGFPSENQGEEEKNSVPSASSVE